MSLSKDTMLEIIHDLLEELDDAADFMETFDSMPESFGDEGLERLRRKVELINLVSKRLSLK